METAEALAGKLATLLEQYKQVEAALELSPEDKDLQAAKKELQEVITLTEDLFRLQSEKDSGSVDAGKAANNTSTTPTEASYTSSASSSLLDQQSALASGSYPVGTTCQALWSEDQRWYDAMVTAITPSGKYFVTFLGYGNTQECGTEQLRPMVNAASPAAGGSGAATTSAAATAAGSTSNPHKRKKAEDDLSNLVDASGAFVVPEKLRILPNDSEEVIEKKKRKIKALKKKVRQRKIEQERNQKKQSWQSFTEKKGKKRRLGFLTGMRKDSIFKSPEGVQGKVGVTGSGKEMTPQLQDSRTQYKKKAVTKVK
ncbi:Survival motor neuron [Balamuthia mandrillaris]